MKRQYAFRIGRYLLLAAALISSFWCYHAYKVSLAIGNTIESARNYCHIETVLRSPAWLRRRLRLSFLYPIDHISSIYEYETTGELSDDLQPLIESHVKVESLRLYSSSPYDTDINRLTTGLKPEHLIIVVNDEIKPSSSSFEIEWNSSLTSLTVSGWRIGNEVWQLVNNASNLEMLNITGCHEVTEIPAEVAGLKELRVFRARSCPIHDKYFMNISRCGNLEFVDCSATAIGDKGMKALCHNELLRTLLISSTNISQTGFSNIRKLKRLEVLDASNTSIESLMPLLKCERLMALDVSEFQLNSEEVELIVTLPRLQCLTVTLHDFGIGMVEPLVMRCPQLQNIHIEGILLDKATIEQYASKRPGVHIQIGDDSNPCWMSYVEPHD